MTELNQLTAIAPADGRYRKQTEKLASYFSESALIRYRLQVEVEYFIALCELPLPQLKQADNKKLESLRDVYKNFGDGDAREVKDTEKQTNHDVKAVEYFLKKKIEESGLGSLKEFVH